MNEKIINRILAIPIAISFSIIIIFCIFFIGLTRVDAKSYYWSEPHTITFNNDNTFNLNPVKRCDNTNSCFYSDTGNYVANYANFRYIVASSNEQSETLEEATYQVSIRVRLVALDTLNKSNLKLTMWVYPYNSNYLKATCDGDQTTKITYNNNSDRDVYVEYKCTALKIVGSFSNFGVQIGGTPNTLFGAQVSSNLRLTGPGENEEIINNQNQNTQDIINNQNDNTQDIINNQNDNADKITENQDKNQQQTNQGLKDIEGAITDDTAPNLDSFDDMSGWLPPGPLDSVLNIPLNILNGLVGTFNNNTCSSISIPIPFIGGVLELPCLYSIYNSISGLSIALTTFFTAITGYLMFKYLSNLYVWIDKTLKMEDSTYMQDWGGV